MRLIYNIEFRFFLSLASLFLFFACKKNLHQILGIANVTVANVVLDGSHVKLANVPNRIEKNNSSKVAIPAGYFPLYAYPENDSLNPYFVDSKFYTEERSTYSLFLAGQSSSIKGIIIQDEFPYHIDSTFGVRFINLCPYSPAINVTLSSSAKTNEVSNLTYLKYTEFKLFSARADKLSYIFQIRDASDSSLLAAYSLSPIPRFANITLVLRGGDNNKLGITRINNDR